MQLSSYFKTFHIGCFAHSVLAVAFMSCASSTQKKLDSDKMLKEVFSTLPANGPLIDNSDNEAHRRVRKRLMTATRFVFADYVSYKRVRILKNDEVLPPIDATLVRSAVRTSKWGEFAEKMFGRHLWVVFYDENGQLAGALYGRYRHYEVHLGAKQLKSGIIELSDCVEPFIQTAGGKLIARKMPPGSPNPVRVCNQGIIFKSDPFDPRSENF